MSYFGSEIPGEKCPVRVDNAAVGIESGSACANCASQDSPRLPLGRLSRIFLDLYAVNAFSARLDDDLM